MRASPKLVFARARLFLYSQFIARVRPAGPTSLTVNRDMPPSVYLIRVGIYTNETRHSDCPFRQFTRMTGATLAGAADSTSRDDEHPVRFALRLRSRAF